MRMLPRLHPPEEDLVAFIDGQLPLPERVVLERHLSGCDHCQDLLERLERAMLALAMETATAPADAAEEAPRWRVRPAVPVGVLVGALLVAGWVGLQQRRAGPRMQSAA